ncbi:tryptophan synthase subunit alpha [Endozoicomonas sp. ONNA2]|uniref:tryptophan synthase subunit alpha n=1 Tax=Endozoicomonas sp. ONNA2 TaxID=2828741 RepID=UPI0021490084|nr:tryptophan synthase subunit alpha [Endozoicomonas sp. ONNA2]
MSRKTNRITACFARLQERERKALIPYILAGDPPGKTVEVMHQMVDKGADMIELGFPFSDPVADGPVIARAHERAVSHGVTLHDVFAMVSEFRERDNDTPIVLMGYLNPVEIMGYHRFVELASEAGVDGVLMVDLPPEAAGDLLDMLHERGMDMINLITPTTSDDRMAKICRVASGYLYYVSLKGVTGAATLNTADVEQRVNHIRHFANIPVCVGFGIRDGASAAAIGRTADGVIAGSVLVSELARYGSEGQAAIDRVASTIAEMRSAMDDDRMNE